MCLMHARSIDRLCRAGRHTQSWHFLCALDPRIVDVSADYEPQKVTEQLWDADWDDEDAPEEFKAKLQAELEKHMAPKQTS